MDRTRSKLGVFWDLARKLSTLSKCKRLSIGAVIVTDDMRDICAIGYNGPPAQSSNDSCRQVEGNCGCIHGEANALVKLKTHQGGLVMISTASPCEHCAGLIINSERIQAVLYQDYYRDTTGLAKMAAAGIQAYRVADLLGLTTLPGGLKSP